MLSSDRAHFHVAIDGRCRVRRQRDLLAAEGVESLEREDDRQTPGRRSTILNWPLASLITLRDFSMSAGLDASTVTPGNTAPVSSFTLLGDGALSGGNDGDQQKEQGRE